MKKSSMSINLQMDNHALNQIINEARKFNMEDVSLYDDKETFKRNKKVIKAHIKVLNYWMNLIEKR